KSPLYRFPALFTLCFGWAQEANHNPCSHCNQCTSLFHNFSLFNLFLKCSEESTVSWDADVRPPDVLNLVGNYPTVDNQGNIIISSQNDQTSLFETPMDLNSSDSTFSGS